VNKKEVKEWMGAISFFTVPFGILWLFPIIPADVRVELASTTMGNNVAAVENSSIFDLKWAEIVINEGLQSESFCFIEGPIRSGETRAAMLYSFATREGNTVENVRPITISVKARAVRGFKLNTRNGKIDKTFSDYGTFPISEKPGPMRRPRQP
jgi:hypothetical protein